MRVNYDSISLFVIASFPCCLPLCPISLSSRPLSLSTPWPTWKLGSACRETEAVRPSGFRKTPWGQGPGTRLASTTAEAAQGTGGEQGDTGSHRLDTEGPSSQPWPSPITSQRFLFTAFSCVCLVPQGGALPSHSCHSVSEVPENASQPSKLPHLC